MVQATHRTGRSIPVLLNVSESFVGGKRFFAATMHDQTKFAEADAARKVKQDTVRV